MTENESIKNIRKDWKEILKAHNIEGYENENEHN